MLTSKKLGKIKTGDVTPAVKKMIKNMDIPTQLAIKHANIKFLSGLVDLDKFTRYSDLLIQLGRMKQAKINKAKC